MRRNAFVLLTVIMLFSEDLLGQIQPMPQLPLDPGSRTRHVSVFMTMGALEFLSAGFLVQLSDQYAMGLVTSAFILNGPGYFGPDAALSLGVRWAYYFSRDGKDKFLWANAVIVDCHYLLPQRDRTVTWRNPGGVGLEAVVGRDGVVGPGLGIIWGVGIAASLHHDVAPLLFPAIRLGLHLDI